MKATTTSQKSDRTLAVFVVCFMSSAIVAAIVPTISFWLVMGITCLIFAFAAYVIWSAPKALEETDEDKQNLEDWLAKEGYRHFYGEVEFVKSVMIVSFGSKDESFPDSVRKQGKFGNYNYWDRGPYRTVRFDNGDSSNMFFVK